MKCIKRLHLIGVLYTCTRCRVCLETLERDGLVARFANAVDALFHFFERLGHIYVSIFELFDERNVGRQFFYLIGDVVGVGFLPFETLARTLPVTCLALHAPVTRELILERLLFG